MAEDFICEYDIAPDACIVDGYRGGVMPTGYEDALEEEQYLNNYLSQESKDMLSELFQGKEDLLSRYYKHEGWLLNMAILGRKYKLIGYDPDFSVDEYFHNLASADLKPILGLDQVETQLKLFDFDVPIENQVQIIEAALKGAEAQARAEQGLFDAYFCQDTEAFRKTFLKLMDFTNPQIKAMYDRALVSRNKAWVRKFIELSKTKPGSYFVLVGSGHYFGPDNVRKLLEAEEFTIKSYSER